MTLIILGKRRCNASCYNAIRTRCVCVCDGKNHQAGQKEAITRTLDRFWELTGKYGTKLRVIAQEQLAFSI